MKRRDFLKLPAIVPAGLAFAGVSAKAKPKAHVETAKPLHWKWGVVELYPGTKEWIGICEGVSPTVAAVLSELPRINDWAHGTGESAAQVTEYTETYHRGDMVGVDVTLMESSALPSPNSPQASFRELFTGTHDITLYENRNSDVGFVRT